MKEITFRNDVLPLKNELYRLALRITMNREEAEDIVQETLIKVWNRRNEWENIDSIEAYSLTVCRNLALDAIKKMGNQVESIETIGIDSVERPHLTGQTTHRLTARKTTELHATARH